MKGTGQVNEAEGMKKQAETRTRKRAGPVTTSDSDRHKDMETDLRNQQDLVAPKDESATPVSVSVDASLPQASRN